MIALMQVVNMPIRIRTDRKIPLYYRYLVITQDSGELLRKVLV